MAGELSSLPGIKGVIRFVSGGVTYTPPPLTPRWQPVVNEPGRYEMPWEEDAAKAQTLLNLRHELEAAARASRLTDTTSPLLRWLDAVAHALVETVARLHKAGWRLGLIRPDNVVVRPVGERVEVVLVDLGFTWHGADGAPPWDSSPGRPDWLQQTSWNWLWDDPPVRQQFAHPDNRYFPPREPQADLRVLGRLFAWLVSGCEAKVLPALAGRTAPPPTWSVLTDLATGQITSVEQLTERLRAAPLSGFFHSPVSMSPSRPAAGTQRRSRRWPVGLTLIGIAAVLAVIVWGAYAYSVRTRSSQTADSSPASTSTVDWATQLTEFDQRQASGDLPGMFARLAELYASAPPERREDLEQRRMRALESWMAEYRRLEATPYEPADRLVMAARLAELARQLQSLITANPSANPDQQIRERQCLDFVLLRARELGAPPDSLP